MCDCDKSAKPKQSGAGKSAGKKRPKGKPTKATKSQVLGVLKKMGGMHGVS